MEEIIDSKQHIFISTSNTCLDTDRLMWMYTKSCFILYTDTHKAFIILVVMLHYPILLSYQKLPDVLPPGGFFIFIEDLCLVLVITGGGSGLLGCDFKSMLEICWLGAFSGWTDLAVAGGGISPPFTSRSSSFLITGWYSNRDDDLDLIFSYTCIGYGDKGKYLPNPWTAFTLLSSTMILPLRITVSGFP